MLMMRICTPNTWSTSFHTHFDPGAYSGAYWGGGLSEGLSGGLSGGPVGGACRRACQGGLSGGLSLISAIGMIYFVFIDVLYTTNLYICSASDDNCDEISNDHGYQA